MSSLFHQLAALRRSLLPLALTGSLLAAPTAWAQTGASVPPTDQSGSPSAGAPHPAVPIAPPPAHANALPTSKKKAPAEGASSGTSAGQTTEPEAATHGGSLTERLDLSDTHRVWHPSRRQLGLSETGSGYEINPAKLTAYLKSIAPYVRRAPEPARIVLAGSRKINPLGSQSSNLPVPAKVLPASAGIKLNIAASVAKLQSELASDPTATHLLLSVQTTEPKSGSVSFAGIDARLAHFVTRFNPGERGRTQTVRLAIKLINGHVIAPGATFSVNQTVGERTAQRGFGEGIVFINGRQEKQLGGGMCQVATTLFNAALLANMKIVQRFQHVRTVPYVKPGQDATVYWGSKDFKFSNDTDTPIYISYTTTATHAICDLYGKEDPSVKVSVRDTYQHLGPRHYTAVLKRYVTKNGVKTNDYTAYSAYKWTPSLDYNT